MATRWMDTLWATLAEEYAADISETTGPRFEVQLLTEAEVRPAIVSEQAYPLTVVANEELVSDATGLWDFSIEPPRPAAKSITIELPDGVTYDTGNHLAVFAKNEPQLVDRVLARLGVDRDQVLRLDQPAGGVAPPGGHSRHRGPAVHRVRGAAGAWPPARRYRRWPSTRLPVDPAAAGGLHARHRRGRGALPDRGPGQAHLPVLNLLERFPRGGLPAGGLPGDDRADPPRFYSISSARWPTPARAPDRRSAGRTGPVRRRPVPRHLLLLHRRPRARRCLLPLRACAVPDVRPQANQATPLILIGPGTGIAPLRGFLEERAWQHANGAQVGLSQVFVGCRHPEHDYFYRDEMEMWALLGITRVRTALR